MKRNRQAELQQWRLEFEHETRPYVWTGWAASVEQAEADARRELFGAHAFADRMSPRLVAAKRVER